MKITIDVESMGNDTIKANFKGGAKNFDELMSLGGALLLKITILLFRI